MAKTYTQNLLPLSNDWQLYNYQPSSRDEFRGIFTNNPLMPQGQHAGPSMDGLLPQYWGDILSANADMLRQRGYTGPLDFRVQSAQGRDGGGTEGDVRGLVDWMRGQNLAVGQSGPLKDGSARHGSYYTQLFDTSGGGYTPVGTGLQTENEYSADGKGILAVLLAAAGGAALAPSSAGAAGAGAAGAGGATNAALIESALGTAGYGASSAGLGGMGGTAIGLGGSMGGAGWAPASVVNPGIAEAVGAEIAAGLGSGGGLGAAGAAGLGGLGAGGGGIGAGSFAGAGMDAIGTGSLIDLGTASGFGTSGMGAAGASGGGAITGLGGGAGVTSIGGGGMWDSIMGLVGDKSAMDWAKLGLQAYGAYQGANQAKDQQQTQTRDPWGPAQPFILDALQQGQKLNQQYQQQPFSAQQQQAYNNLGGLLSAVNQGIPGLLAGMQANASGANNFDRRNPNRPVQGAQQTYGAWQPGLLDLFPKRGG